MKSSTIRIYRKWLEIATQEQIDFVDSVYHLCETNYERGGDTIVETFEPQEICDEFKTLKEVKEHCKMVVENALNKRCGEDDDPELSRYEASQEW